MKFLLPLAFVVLIFGAACSSTPAPTVPPPATPRAVPTANAAATETAVTQRVLATLTASAPTQNAPAVGDTVTPPPPPQSPATAIGAATNPPPTLTSNLSPSVTPIPELPTRPATAAPTAVPSPAPPQISQETLRGKILFKSARSNGKYPNNFQFFVMNPDGSEQQQIDRAKANALYQQLKPLEGYSPDRQLLVLGEVACNSVRCDLYLGPLDAIKNRSQGVWTPKGVFAATDPVWSPDGSTIAFVWTRDNGRTKNIFKAPPQSNPSFIRLTNFGGKRDTKNPTYSPDSTQLAFATQDGSRWQIWVLEATIERDCVEDNCPSNPHNLSHSGFDDWDPLWIK